MRERDIEGKLAKSVKRKGGLCPKLVCPGFDGMPDRLVLLPGGKIAFVEVKAPGKRPRPLQEKRHAQLMTLGFPVYVLDDPKKIGKITGEVEIEWVQI